MSTKTKGQGGYNIFSKQKPIPMAVVEKPFFETVDEPCPAFRCQPIAEAGSAKTTQLEDREISLATVSVVDKQKVAQLKQAIQEGTYRIDAERIAEKLIALEQTLIKK